MHSVSNMSSTAGSKKVTFGADTLADEAEEYEALNSPLKASTSLGGTIKKLSPVSGAAKTEAAKTVYNRLLKEASMCMFEGVEENESSRENTGTPPFYKQQASAMTPGSGTNRLQSQQFDLSPPLPEVLAPSTPAADGSPAAIIPHNPATPVSHAHKDFIAYREAHSANRSYGVIKNQLQVLRDSFQQAHELGDNGSSNSIESAGPDVIFPGPLPSDHNNQHHFQQLLLEQTQSESGINDGIQASNEIAHDGISPESSPAAVSILSEHLKSIVTANTSADVAANTQIPSDKSSGLVYFSTPESTSKVLSTSTQCQESNIENGMEPSVPIVEEGRRRLNFFATYLQDLTSEFSEQLTEAMSARFPTEPAGSVGNSIKHKLTTQTYSLDEVEAKILQKHELLCARGIVGNHVVVNN